MSPIELALAQFPSKAAMARAIGVSPMAVRQWERRERIPLEHAVRIEQITDGAVTKEQLRPDVFGTEAA